MMAHERNSGAGKKGLTSIADVAYPTVVLTLYVELPDTPLRASSHDQAVARSLFEQGVPIEVVQAALLLGSLRRSIRPPGALPLPPIRSLAYFSPVIDELLQRPPLPAGYLDYLRHKARRVFSQTTTPQGRSPR